MRVRLRFWFEAALALLGALLAFLTLLWRDWIEIVFRVDPDQHGGSAEWFVVVCALALAIGFSVVCGIKWRRPRPALAALKLLDRTFESRI